MQLEKLDLTIACESYDRVAALASGQVQVEGCRANVIPLHAEELFLRTTSRQEFDVSEMSLSSYILATSRSGFPYVAIPVFPSRVFRHSAIYLNAHSGIAAPADLRGKTVGVPEYQMTAAVWARGLLSDAYGVRSQDIRWRTGGLEQPGRVEKLPLALPPGFDVQPIPADQRLSDLLAFGELDAVISARAPSCFGSNPAVTRLFPDYKAAERDYFRQTGLFPIMHVVVVRRSLADRHPWLPSSLFKAFSQAKAAGVSRLGEIGALAVTLPWLVAEYEETVREMGRDYWPYGIERNRAALSAVVRYAEEQGLTSRRMTIEELFAPGLEQDGSAHV